MLQAARGNLPLNYYCYFIFVDLYIYFFLFYFIFLALLDYVSRAHEITISSVVRPSSVRPCRNYL